jgi:hypothetical protein
MMTQSRGEWIPDTAKVQTRQVSTFMRFQADQSLYSRINSKYAVTAIHTVTKTGSYM